MIVHWKENIIALLCIGLFISCISFLLPTTLASKEIIIIDSDIMQPDLLLRGLKRNADIHYLSAKENPINQISDILKKYTKINNLHLISHGGKGTLLLANNIYDANNIQDYKDLLVEWHNSFVKEGNLFLYGCEIAGNSAGKLFVDRLSQLTRLNLYASDNLTGSKHLLADSDFEYFSH